MNKSRLLPVLIALLIVPLAFAAGTKLASEGTWEGYINSPQTSAYREGISAVDSVDLSTVSTITTLGIGARTTLAVSPRMTAASGTCTVRVAYYYYSGGTYYLTHVDTATQFTCDVETEAGVYTDEPFLFDTYSGTHALVLVSGAPSAGTLDLWVARY